MVSRDMKWIRPWCHQTTVRSSHFCEHMTWFPGSFTSMNEVGGHVCRGDLLHNYSSSIKWTLKASFNSNCLLRLEKKKTQTAKIIKDWENKPAEILYAYTKPSILRRLFDDRMMSRPGRICRKLPTVCLKYTEFDYWFYESKEYVAI